MKLKFLLILLMLTSFLITTTCPPIHSSSSQEAPETVSINFVGDILLGSTVGELMDIYGPDFAWGDTSDILSAADFTLGNLECPVGTTGEPLEGKTWTFQAKPSSLEGLAGAGFDIVSLANNHALDYGTECLLETIEHLDNYGITGIGAGATEEEARKPVILEKNGIRIGVLASTMVIPDGLWAAKADRPGLAVDYSDWSGNIVSRIHELSGQTDIIIVLIHWGTERSETPVDWVMRMENILLDAGANIIIGSHPHVLQGFRYDGNTLTSYSLGNYVFTTRPEFPRCQQGAILNVVVSKEGIVSSKVIPTKIVWGQTFLLQEEISNELSYIAGLSLEYSTDLDEEGNLHPIPFLDIVGHWSRFIISELHGNGIVLGDNGYFYPDNAVSRKECAALLLRTMLDEEEMNPPQPEDFSLCPENDWAYLYLNYLASRNIIPEDISLFNPSEDCSREEAFTWLWKIAGSPEPENLTQDIFTDLDTASPEAKAAIEWLYNLELVKGYEDNTVRLASTITRAEVSTILYRLLGTVDFVD